MKKQHQGILLFTDLLNEIEDIKSELIKPDDFAERSHYAYKVLLENLETYLFEDDMYHLNRYQEMKARLDILLANADQIITIHKEITGNLNISPYRAGLAMYVSTQLTEALNLIHPDNVVK